MTQRQIIVLQHVACETLGSIEDVLTRANLGHRYVRIHHGEQVPSEIGDAAGLVVMGGPMSVYDNDKLPHLNDEMRLVESALKAQRPILGICLGSQLLAHVLGAKVYPGKQKEIGWHEVSLTTAASDDPLLAAAPGRFPAFHWHGDVFDLPRSAMCLAKSHLTACQAFRHGHGAYGILFHMEVTRPGVRSMIDSFPHEVAEVGSSAEAILTDTTAHLGRLMEIGDRVFEGWAKMAAAG
jgi:GMP synthase (glutamine-hydrolysing)